MIIPVTAYCRGTIVLIGTTAEIIVSSAAVGAIENPEVWYFVDVASSRSEGVMICKAIVW
jgi:hypothetical protein